MYRTLCLLALVSTGLLAGCERPPQVLRSSNLGCLTTEDFERVRMDPVYKETKFFLSAVTTRDGSIGLYYCMINKTTNDNSNQSTEPVAGEME